MMRDTGMIDEPLKAGRSAQLLDLPPTDRPLSGLCAGWLVEAEGATLIVQLNDRRVAALRAVSCLIEPILGDEVLVFAQPDTCHVLAVLTRGDLGDATLSLPDPAAALTLNAQAVRLEAATRIDLAAPELAVSTRRMHIVADVLTQIVKLASTVAEQLRTAVGHQSTIARQLDVKAESRNTIVAGVDVEQLGTQVTRAELSAANASIVTVHAKEDIRLDAKRVTIG